MTRTKIATSQDAVHTSMMAELRCITCCDEVEDVGIEVNWDRLAGMTNWWVTRIRYRNPDCAGPHLAGSEAEISRVEAVLQARYFVEANDGFRLGIR